MNYQTLYEKDRHGVSMWLYLKTLANVKIPSAEKCCLLNNIQLCAIETISYSVLSLCWFIIIVTRLSFSENWSGPWGANSKTYWFKIFPNSVPKHHHQLEIRMLQYPK